VNRASRLRRSKEEQHAAIKSCFKAGLSAMEITEHTYGEETLNRADIFRCHDKFPEENPREREHSGRPITSRALPLKIGEKSIDKSFLA